MTCLLQTDDIPIIVPDDIAQCSAFTSDRFSTYNLAVTVFGLARLCVTPMPIYGATSDIGIANDQTVSLCCCQFIKILLYSVFRETVADGQHFDYALAAAHHRKGDEQGKRQENSVFHDGMILDVDGFSVRWWLILICPDKRQQMLHCQFLWDIFLHTFLLSVE